jgi:conjugal transfer pilus assembly protein TraW
MGRNRQDIEISKLLLMLILLIISSISVSRYSHAKDFGVLGHSYEIFEQDIIEYIKAKLESQDLEALNQEMQEKVKARISRPEPVVGITDAKENREYTFDPTFVLREDIRDHTRSAVQQNGQLIHAEGTEINPLSKVPLGKVLIFINGDNEKQVEYAFAEYKVHNEKAKIILTSGSPVELQKKHQDVWIYFDQFGALTKKLGIKAVPAIVKQEGLKLKISEVDLR